MGKIIVMGLRELGVARRAPRGAEPPQPFEVDVELEVDLGRGGQSDDLDDTVDYAAVSEAVSRVVKNERYQLLERLATRIGEVCRTDERVERGDRHGAQAPSAGAGDARPRRGARHGVTRAYLGLGSNLGDRLGHLQRAVDGARRHRRHPRSSRCRRCTRPRRSAGRRRTTTSTRWSRSTPTSCRRELLAVAMAVEQLEDRVRTVRWGPRTLDVDVLLVRRRAGGRRRSRDPAPADVRARVRARAAARRRAGPVEQPADGWEACRRTSLRLRLPYHGTGPDPHGPEPGRTGLP